MKKNKRFIDCYMEWIKTGKMTKSGLCNSLPFHLRPTYYLVKPTIKERVAHWEESGELVYWGINDPTKEHPRDFTPLRQTIVLLCAVMEGEEF